MHNYLVPGLGESHRSRPVRLKEAQKLGISRDSRYRACAGTEHILLEATQQGHCAIPGTDLLAKASQLLEMDSLVVEQALAGMLTKGDQPRQPLQQVVKLGESFCRFMLRCWLMPCPAEYSVLHPKRRLTWSSSEFAETGGTTPDRTNTVTVGSQRRASEPSRAIKKSQRQTRF